MPYSFCIKNIEFLECLNVIKREDIDIYRFIEKLIYDEIPKEKILLFKKQLREVGVINFVKIISETIPKPTIKQEVKTKRKIITENMLENYVIRNR